MPNTPNTFTVVGQKFTVGEKMLCGNNEVEIVGPVGSSVEAPSLVAFKYPNGNIASCHPEHFKPILEPTIEVPVSVAKVLAFGYPETVMEVPAAMQTMTDLLREAGY
jgi:hypothetical protein